MRTTKQRGLAEALWPVGRRRVLGLLLADPERELHLRELVRRTELAPATVQAEVVRLTAAGILERRREGRQVYYRANRTCPIFPELRGLVLKTVGLADVLREALEPVRVEVRAAFVFGSVAEGQTRNESDVDLMVIGEATLRSLAGGLQEAQRALGREINAVTMRPREFADRVAGEDHFLRTVLEGPKIFLIGDAEQLAGLGKERPAAEA